MPLFWYFSYLFFVRFAFFCVGPCLFCQFAVFVFGSSQLLDSESQSQDFSLSCDFISYQVVHLPTYQHPGERSSQIAEGCGGVLKAKFFWPRLGRKTDNRIPNTEHWNTEYGISECRRRILKDETLARLAGLAGGCVLNRISITGTRMLLTWLWLRLECLCLAFWARNRIWLKCGFSV